MKVQLDKDPLYDTKQSPLKTIKERQKLMMKERRERRFSLNNKELEVEIIDPLPIELNKYKKDVTYSRITEKSKAYENLKKYIISQERKQQFLQVSLKHVRLEKIVLDDVRAHTTSLDKSSNDIQINFVPARDEEKQLKEIHIPKVQELFRYQVRDKLIHENHQLVQKLGVQHGLMEKVVNEARQLGDGKHQDSSKFHYTLSKEKDLDKIIEQNFTRNRQLFSKLDNQKRVISKFESNNHNGEELVKELIKLQGIKEKKKEMLKGIQSYSVKEGDRSMEMSPPTMLLYELHKLCGEKQKKQLELTSLLKNSYQNRRDTLLDKSNFYQDRIKFEDMSPESQFRLRKIMNKKLSHRLELSKQQVHNFVSYLYELKNEHMIINEEVIEILAKIRENLLGGKVMKNNDLQAILSRYKQAELEVPSTAKIITRLRAMMI